jgi:hypothetical protein
MANNSLAILSARAAKLAQPVGATPWRDVAETAEYVHRRGSIVVPPNDGSYNTIVDFTVQAGYEAVLSHLLFVFSGATPPQEGDSASIFYAVRIDGGFYARDFQSIDTSLGSLANGPYPIPGGLRLKAGQTVEGLVNVPVTSAISTGPGNFSICHLIGWQWPDRD